MIPANSSIVAFHHASHRFLCRYNHHGDMRSIVAKWCLPNNTCKRSIFSRKIPISIAATSRPLCDSCNKSNSINGKWGNRGFSHGGLVFSDSIRRSIGRIHTTASNSSTRRNQQHNNSHTKMSCLSQSSYSNPQQIKVTHHSIHLEVATKKKILSGYVEYTCEPVGLDTHEPRETDFLILDARNLEIENCVINGEKVPFEVRDASALTNYNETFGTPLSISLQSVPKDQKQFKVTVHYKTTQKSEAVVWMDKEQTLGKKKPFMFTQCQAIHARSMLPCQDTPEVKATFDAVMTCDDPDMKVVMGALPQESSNKGEFVFSQKKPIPSYLIAIAAGNLSSKKIGPRTILYTEPEQLEDFAYEFEDTEKFLQALEEFLPKYAWEEYNILVPSPSYNFGGMENVNLTLVSASLLAGDKSLASVVAHEISHSWSGNLVTNRTWRDFWLNEGICVYLERRCLARMYGQAYADFDAILKYKSLEDSIEHFLNVENNPEFTKMVPDLQGYDPDSAFSTIPYEAGFNFLYYCTKLVGGFDKMEKFLHDYFEKYAFKTISTNDFKTYFLDYFKDSENKDRLAEIEWDKWLYGIGRPPITNDFDRSLAVPVEKLAQQWKDGSAEGSEEDMKDWKALQICYFLDLLQKKKDWTAEQLENMDRAYKLSSTRNFEIRYRWFMVGILSNYEKVYPETEKFLGETGRMKFVRPLFRALLKAKNGRPVAEAALNKYRDFYMATTLRMLEKDFKNVQ